MYPSSLAVLTFWCSGDNGNGVRIGLPLLLGRNKAAQLTCSSDSSFLAGALPLSMSLSQQQLRLLSSVGVGILVGTSLIVIIPEGIESVAARAEAPHAHESRRSLTWRGLPSPTDHLPRIHHDSRTAITVDARENTEDNLLSSILSGEFAGWKMRTRREDSSETESPEGTPEHRDAHAGFPTVEIGFSLILGFVLMFLVDRLPRHATDSLHSAPQTQHMSLENLGGAASTTEEEAEGFLGSLAPTPRKARSLATTLGLVIHAAADGIAMGATTTTSDLKLGLVVFLAILVHKAPAALSLTSILLKQGLSKRAARGHLIVFSLAAPVGALTTWLLITMLGGEHLEGESKQWWTGMLLLFSGGTFL